jgi:hypothetical protein
MAHPQALRRSAGPLERTAIELEHLRRAAAFRRGRELLSQRRLRESDLLLDLVEECRLRGYPLIPGQVWAAVVRLVGSVHVDLRDQLGGDRHPEHVADVLFLAQEDLMARRVHDRQPRLAEIIPLFPDRPDERETDQAVL